MAQASSAMTDENKGLILALRDACLSKEEKQELLALLGKLNGAWGERWGKQEGTP